MALSILSSNRVETLQSRLAQQLASTPPGDPFSEEVVVVPTYAMARWLNMRIAQQHGVAANIRFPLPGQWIWQLAASLLDDIPRDDPYAPESLSWRIFSLLPQLAEEAAFADLQKYLADDASGIKRWQLSARIAQAFDRYQLYRPEQIRAWSSGKENHWQALLWRQIIARQGQPHRIQVISAAIGQLAQAPADARRLPGRVSLFGVSCLAPVYIEFIHALAAATEVSMYQHSPTDQYWADIVSDKIRARRQLQRPDHDVYMDTGNSLLASWGRQGQALQDLLLDLGPVTSNEIDASQVAQADSMLNCLQNSLFSLADRQFENATDDSISLHICHSPMRECQVLHDYLLHLLDRHDALACEDILVMVPEISRYAPYIEAVFQQDDSGNRPNLPWNISDISVSAGHPLTRVFLQLLKLPGLRFTRSEVMAFLECREIRDRFGIEPDMLEQIHYLVDAAQVHWGIDAAQRQALDLPGTHENTWQQAWERIFSGFAFADQPLWRGIAPITAVDADSASAMASFRRLFERLVYWRDRLAQFGSVENWQQRLHQMLDEFFVADALPDDRLQPLRDAIGNLGGAGGVDLSPALVSYWMEAQLSTSQQPGRLYSGGITFCGMQPMRNIPFPVICVMGMQDQAFPRGDHPAEFDLMRQDWRPGDPSKRDEDRYLMLETLLSARRYLYFSYCGRSLRDNSVCQPSVLLQELLDYIDASFVSAGAARPASEEITRVHPMSAFSKRNFQAESPGYDRYWYDTAGFVETGVPAKPVDAWAGEAIAPAAATEPATDLESLLRFFDHPIRYFFNNRLGITATRDRPDADEESFALDALQKWALAERLASDFLQGESVDVMQVAAEGLLPHGRAGVSAYENLERDFAVLLDRLRPFSERQPLSRSIECEVPGGDLLFGEVGFCYPGIGLMHYTASKALRARAAMRLWLNHLALCAAGQLAQTESSQLLTTTDDVLDFAWLDRSAASACLSRYIELFYQGQRRPLPVFPDSSFAWAAEWNSSQDSDKALKKALTAWNGASFTNARPGERDDEFIRLALRNNLADPLGDASFEDAARRIYLPALQHAHRNDR
ncbi:MAG: exodeoxyribonuclease V subunit gamma [Gammaproteobacteria bacterium]|nr:exodeoxyribonuclease V subunit gamma [Gammaproteobacteria bacterium]MDH3534317.1 exodeoxyribonuclease V subunit gamma [Gammaproteobacteria bacterium]